MSAKEVLIISADIFPVPANLGGAVEGLIDVFAENNAVENRYHISITSCDYNGVEIKKKVEGVEYLYFKPHFFDAKLDNLYFFYMNKIRKDWRSMFSLHHYKNLHYIRDITKKLDLTKYDVIVVQNNMSLLETLAKSLGPDFDRKCMYHMHSDLVDNTAMIPYLARCRKIIAVSNFVKNHLYETVPEFKNTEIVKVTNGVAVKEYSPEERITIRKDLRKKYGIDDDATVYLFSGRVSPEKGVLELAKAFSKAIPEFTHKSCLVIVGSGVTGSNEETYYSKQVKEIANECPGKIICTGYINHNIITHFHLMSDVQVVPSIFDDPAPLTVLEGMSMGIFLLLSRAGGIPEYSVDYENKIIFERGDRFEQNIQDALLAYDTKYAPHDYEFKPVFFDEKQFYNELAEAIDI